MNEDSPLNLPPETRNSRLLELFALFLRLGFTAFGGPAAHIAMLEDEVVRRRQWLSSEAFLDLLGITNLIPGPNSTEMVLHTGHVRAGIPGMVVAGLAFILPAAGIVSVFAWVYIHFGALPQFEGILYGVKPVVLAIIVQALIGLGRTAIKTRALAAAAAVAVAANLLGMSEVAALALIGVSWAAIFALRNEPARHIRGLLLLGTVATAIVAASALGPWLFPATEQPFGLGALFWFFLKVGSVLYGSGYVLLAFIQSDLVDHWQWITQAELLDAVAVGQFTPGPLFTTATFIGFLLAGGAGAAVATTAIFLPAFFFVALCGPLVPKIRTSALAGAFLDGVNAAALALMAVVTLRLAWGSIVDPFTFGLTALAGLLLIRYRLNATWLILGGAVLGTMYTLLGSTN